MCLSDVEKSILQELYEYNRIPLWIYKNDLTLYTHFTYDSNSAISSKLSTHMQKLALQLGNCDFEILCYSNELYYSFTYEHQKEPIRVIGGPMLLTGFCCNADMKNLSFGSNLSMEELQSIISILPIVSYTTFSSSLRIVMLFLKKSAPSLEEIRNYKIYNSEALEFTFIYEIFTNLEEHLIHTPYSDEVALLNCVKEGNLSLLEMTYKTLPQVVYGNMSKNPLKQLFYGCIANTTLITRYAIEGGLDDETAYTLSDIYIRQMEDCKTVYDLQIINEKMAIDFTERVSRIKPLNQPVYPKTIARCIKYINRNISTKITLEILSKEVSLSPKYLSNLFQKQTGKTFTSFVEDIRINKAKELLAYTNRSYSDISHYLSFYSQSYFISVFKKRTGMTPKEYRNKFSPN